MKKHYIYRPTKFGALITIIVSIILLVFLTYFLMDAVVDFLYNLRLYDIERYAEQGHYTADGFVNWTDKLYESYNSVEFSKKLFLSDSLVGRIFLALFRGNILSLLIETLIIIAAIVLTAYSVEMLLVSAKFFSRSLAGYPDPAVRRASSHRCR